MRHSAAVCGMAIGLSTCVAAQGAVDVLVNQVGYPPNAPKVFRVQRTSDFAGEGTFSVREAGTSTEVHTGVLTRAGALWDKWYWTGDFSAFRRPGDYYITAGVGGESGSSYAFRIGRSSLLDDTGTLVYQYFGTQRCGVAVPGWHAACHLDDGLRHDNSQHVDAVGGWHDAGDYNKFADGVQGDGVLYLLWLYEAYRDHYDAIDTDGNGIADIVDEALHGARWLAKMVQADGRVWARTAKRRWGATWVRPESDTNNTIGDWDDRWIEIGEEGVPQVSMVCAALIRMHSVLESLGRPTEGFADEALAAWNRRASWAASSGWPENIGFAFTQLWAGLDLYERFGQQNCRDVALTRVNQEALAVIADPARYDTIWDHPPAMDLGMFAWFARNYPDAAPAANSRNALQALMAHNLALADNPIGLIQRKEGSTYYHFDSDPDWNAFFLGLNRFYLLLTWASIEAYKALGDPACLRFAMDHYNWVMGANYNRVCMMENAGDVDLPKYHTRYDTIPGHEDGAQPGVVPNGYVRVYNTGLPHIDLSGNRYQSNEGWLINNAAYAMALNAMRVFEDDAEYISDTIPNVMYPGQTYTVSVNLRNNSYMPWSRQNEYRLGAVDDTDPFAATRHEIDDGVTIGHGEAYTWTFEMTAPMTPGLYTTDWRMVHELVCWFGQTAGRQVEVVEISAPGPVTQFAAMPGGKQITLSWINPGDIQFQGTMIRYSTAGYPGSPDEGSLLVYKENVPGSVDTCVHDGLPNGIRHYYSAFTRDPYAHWSAAVTVSAVPIAVADFDRDGDVDQEDFGHFQACYSGTGTVFQLGCESADFDGDNDVDNLDFLRFQSCMGGSRKLPGC